RHEAGRGRAGEHRTAEPRVARERDGASSEGRADRPAHLQREVRVHVGAHDASDSVRPEETRHALTRSSTIVANAGICTPSAPMIDEEISVLSSTLTASRRAAFVREARPILHDLPRTTCGPRRPSTNDPPATYTGGRSEPADTSASEEIFPRPASRRTRCECR